MNERAFPAPEERGGPLRRAFVRHPWWFATIFGLILIPAIRPCTRHVPDPPPILGVLPELKLTNSSGESFDMDNVRRKVWVLSFYENPCDADCERVVESMKALQQRLVRADVPVSLLTIGAAHPSDIMAFNKSFLTQANGQEDPWPLAFGSVHFVTRLKEELSESTRKQTTVGQPEAARAPKVRSNRLILIDWSAGIRGSYPATPLGVDEIFHRSQHVLRQMNEQLQGPSHLE